MARLDDAGGGEIRKFEPSAPIEPEGFESIARDVGTRFVARTDDSPAAGAPVPVALPLAARIDPVVCPACRMLQRQRFAREVIERIELVAAFVARATAAFEQQVG